MPLFGNFRLLANRLRSRLDSATSFEGTDRAKILLYSLCPVFDGSLYAYLDGLRTSLTLTEYLIAYLYPSDTLG
jgi:hypothetical protein